MNKKNVNIRRIVTKSGQVRYYANGKRLKDRLGKKKFIQQNPNLPLNQYTKSEQKSAKSKQRYNDAWKFKGVQIQDIYIEILKKLGVPVNNAKNKDLATILDKDGKPRYRRFMDVQKEIDKKAKTDKNFLMFLVEKGMPNYRGRDYDTFKDKTAKNITDLSDILDTEALRNYTLVVTDPDGDEHRGRVKGLLSVRDFEINVGEEILKLSTNSAFLRFDYSYRLDFKNREMLIDLQKTNKYKELSDYIDRGFDPKESLDINDLWENVSLEVMFS
jgi:hypothetical protein